MSWPSVALAALMASCCAFLASPTHILAKPGLRQHHGRFLADSRQRARHPWPQRLTALLRADAVLDEQGRLAAGEFANAEARQLIVKFLHLGLALWNLQSTDELIGDFRHDTLHVAEQKSAFRRAAFCLGVLGQSADSAQNIAGISEAYAAFCWLLLSAPELILPQREIGSAAGHPISALRAAGAENG